MQVVAYTAKKVCVRQVVHTARTLSHEATRSLCIPPGGDTSRLQGQTTPVIGGLFTPSTQTMLGLSGLCSATLKQLSSDLEQVLRF